MAAGVPGAIGLCTAVLVFTLSAHRDEETAHSGDAAVPAELAGYSHLTGIVSNSPPGPGVALYQHGFGVEFLDFPQAVVLGAGGDAYRRVDVAEDRAGAESQGDPAPMLLSPDGTTVAVGDHDIIRPDIVLVDLVTGATTRHPLPAGRSVVPIAWSGDSRRLAYLASAAPTNPHSGEPILGNLGLLDVEEGSTVLLQADDTVSAAAFSPDGTELAVQVDEANGGPLWVVDLTSGSRRVMEAPGVLAGPAAWSPDGRLLATTTREPSSAPPGVSALGRATGLVFVNPARRGRDGSAQLELALAPQGEVLGWNGSDEVLTLLAAVGQDPCCRPDAYELSAIPLDGGPPRTLMRITGLQSFGVSRFQLASAILDDLRVVAPVAVDRGESPLWLRGGMSMLVGLLALGTTRAALRRARPDRRTHKADCNREATRPDQSLISVSAHQASA
jgi:hypothetical protein